MGSTSSGCKCYSPESCVCAPKSGVGFCAPGSAGGLGGLCRSYARFVSLHCCDPVETWYDWHGPKPYITHQCRATDEYRGNVLLVIPPCTVIRFVYDSETRIHNSTEGYTLTYQGGNYTVVAPDGTPVTLDPGTFHSGPGENGNTVYAFDPDDPDNPNADPYTDAGELKGVKTSYTVNGVTTTFAHVYTYDEGASLTSAVLRRRVGDAPWEDLQRALFTYYPAPPQSSSSSSSSSSGSAATANGLEGDLETVTQQFYEGGQWTGDRVWYFRYYVDDQDGGQPHAMKYALEPEQYELLKADPEVSDPLEASDAKVAQYAAKSFEYDEYGHITKKIVFGQEENSIQSQDGDLSGTSYNTFRLKTTETRPDGSVRIEYANFKAQPILTEFKESADADESSLDYYEYDDSGNLLEHATPSALAGYTVDGYTITPQYRPEGGQYNVGLIHVYDYYDQTTTDTGGVAAEGYKEYDKIKHGRDGTEIKLRRYEYTEHSATIDTGFGGSSSSSSSSSSSGSSGAGTGTMEVFVYPIAREISYRNDDGTGEIATSYSYEWYPGTTQMLQRVTTLPAVPASQNGSGVAATRVERFDEYGNVIWLKNDRGTITYNEYDVIAGQVSRSIQDVDDAQLSVPQGWSTPSGGGLHLVTDYEYDVYGRPTQVLGPEHNVDGQTVRTASWTVYKDADRETWSAQGYAVPLGSSSSSSSSCSGLDCDHAYTLVNPVSIQKQNAAGTRSESITATRASTTGKLSASDSFPQSSYVRWSVSLSNNKGQLASTRQYHTIPESGDGASGTNYDEATYGYDALGRQNMTKTPGGTITRTVFNALGQQTAVYVGIDDSGATDDDPTGCSTSSSSSSSSSSSGCNPDNNMVLVAESQYAGPGGCTGCGGGGSGQLTATIQHVDATTTRATEFLYDWRNRQQYAIHEADDQGRVTFSRNEYDNLDRVIRTERYHDVYGDGVDPDDDPQPDDVLLARQEAFYDDRGRTYQTAQYAVNPTTGIVGSALVGHAWYDAAGNTIKQQAAGSDAFTKTLYDPLGRPIKTYVGYDLTEAPSSSSSSSSSSSPSGPTPFPVPGTYADATNVDGDTILEQSETEYDDAGQVILTTSRQRFHNATGMGGLTNPSGDQPKARVSYAALWYDGVGRPKATADYGTNGDGTKPTRPDSPPESSDTLLVTTTLYNATGEAYATIDPAGREDRQEFDDAGRVLKTIQNYTDGDPTTGGADEDVTVETTYGADGQVLTLTAKNPTTGDQTTRYAYGTTLSDSQIARADLLRAEIYPDSDDITDPLGDGTDGLYDRVEYTYNRQGERITKKDQNETVHQYAYDALGRPTADKVTTVGPGVDDAVRRIATTYEVRGMVATITSYATPGDASSSSSSSSGGDAVNQVVFEYDDLGKLVKEYQEHAGVKDANTPYVGYQYDDTSSAGRFTKGLRPTAIRYPNGRLVHYTYGSADSTPDALNRIDAICDDDSGSPGDVLAQYSYLGAGTIVQVDYPEPDLRYDLAHGSGDDPYDGLDRFGRVIDLLWRNYGTEEDAVRIRHGYDRAGNRLWREDPVAAGYGKHFDELYTYDGLYQLATMQRGDLDFTDPDNPVILSKTFAEDWTLDATGNWSTYRQDTDGDSTWDLDQSRTHNSANEITQISGSNSHVAHDRCGNMTRIPKPDDWSDHYHLEYDAWNRLVRVFDADETTKIAEHTYDGATRRTLRRSYSGGQLENTRRFYYTEPSQWQVIEEHLNSSTDPDRQFIWGLRYVDDLIVRDRDSDGDTALDERLYGLQDPNWNIAAMADETGGLRERSSYQAYGKPAILGAAFGSAASFDYDWEYRYTTRRLDGDGSRYLYRIRYYDSLLGRFGSRDPVAFETMPSRYAYLRNRPLAGVDPSGAVPIICTCDVFDVHGGYTYTTDVAADWTSGTVGDTCRSTCTGHARDPRVTRALFVTWSGGWRFKRTIQPGAPASPSALCANVEDSAKCTDECCTRSQCDYYVRAILLLAKSVHVASGRDHCGRWTTAFEAARRRSMPKGYKSCLDTQGVLFRTNIGVWYIGAAAGRFERHCAIKVTLCDGTEFYVDNGWLGGHDHFFYPEEIPGGGFAGGYAIEGYF